MKIWNLLNGKKTVIGVILIIILRGIVAVFPDLLSLEVQKWIEDILLLFTGGIGIGHKIIKKEL
jgi:hypothetical protein